LLFVLDCWPDLSPNLYEWQREFLDGLGRGKRTALLAPRDSGKSFTVALAAIRHLVLNPGSLVLLVAPIARQADQGVMLEVRSLWMKSEVLRGLFPSWRLLSDSIETDDPQWRLLSTATDRPERLEAPHSPGPPLVVIDEARGLPDDFLKSLEGVLAHPSSRLIACSVAGAPRGFFYDAFHGNHGAWDRVVEVPLSAIPHVERHHRELVKRYGEADVLIRQQYLNVFADVREWGAFFAPELLRKARGLDPDRNSWRLPLPTVFGWDVAGYGGDDSVLCKLTGRRVAAFKRLPAGDPMLQVALVRQEVEEYTCTVAVDVVGIGAGHHSRLREVLASADDVWVAAFNASAAARDSERYGNRKTEIVFALLRALQDGTFGLPAEGDVDGDRLVSELSGLSLVEAGQRGAVRVVDPKKSPDFADSLIAALSVIGAAPFYVPQYYAASPDWL